jgi:hypothetical protein
MNDGKVFMGLKQVSVENAQGKNYLDKKNPRKGGKNGRKHVLKMGCYFKS